MVQLKGDIPQKAKNYIKFHIQSQRGQEREDKVWKLKEVLFKDDKENDPIFVFQFKKRTRPSRKVSRKTIMETVSVPVSRKFLGW